MKKVTKIALAAVTASGLAVSAQAQYASGDLLLGFTDGNAAHSDLVLDLGPFSGLTSGALNSPTSPGNVGFTTSGLQSELNGLYTSFNNFKFGVVGAQSVGLNPRIFATALHGAAAPLLGNPGQLKSAVDTVGSGIGSGFPNPNPTANSSLYAANAGSSVSWTEQIQGSGTPWGLNADLPSFSGSSTAAVVEDLYQKLNGVETLAGTITLNPSGEVDFAPVAVPEASTYGVLAGLGLLALSLRRQIACKMA
jgi:hypothetical protein